MRSRWLMAAGILCLLVAGSTMAVGFTNPPWLTLIAAVLGATMLTAALAKVRTETVRPQNHDPARGERLVRLATLVLAALAVGHLLTGLLCLGLFAALAFPWHPPAGSGAATLRGLVLSLLALAALGSFLESLGGAGYDAANAGRRIEALTTLHDIAVPFGAFLIGAVPLGVITGIVVLIGWATRRSRAVRT